MIRVHFDQRGVMNLLVVPLIILVVLFIGVSSFAVWAYSSRQTYKNHSDQLSAAAAQVAVKATQATDAAAYAQKEKLPFSTYVSPAADGTITVNYPKTWSAYVVEGQNGADPVNGYFDPGFVPDVTNESNTFALRVDLVPDAYDTVLSNFESAVSIGQVTVSPYSLPKVPSVVGVEVNGQITPTAQGEMIVLPLRGQTLEIWTESNAFLPDFQTNILPNLSFAP